MWMLGMLKKDGLGISMLNEVYGWFKLLLLEVYASGLNMESGLVPSPTLFSS